MQGINGTKGLVGDKGSRGMMGDGVRELKNNHKYILVHVYCPLRAQMVSSVRKVYLVTWEIWAVVVRRYGFSICTCTSVLIARMPMHSLTLGYSRAKGYQR